jgi:hypothetical protein
MAFQQGPTGPAGSPRAVFTWTYSNGVATSADRFVQRASTNALSSEAGGQTVVLRPRTLVRLVVTILGTPYVTDSATFTLRKNGVDTALTLTLAAGATSGSVTGSVSVAAGDRLTVKLNQSGTESTAGIVPYIYASDV